MPPEAGSWSYRRHSCRESFLATVPNSVCPVLPNLFQNQETYFPSLGIVPLFFFSPHRDPPSLLVACITESLNTDTTCGSFFSGYHLFAAIPIPPTLRFGLFSLWSASSPSFCQLLGSSFFPLMVFAQTFSSLKFSLP